MGSSNELPATLHKEMKERKSHEEFVVSVQAKPMAKCHLRWYERVDWPSVAAFTVMFVMLGIAIYTKGGDGGGAGDDSSADDSVDG